MTLDELGGVSYFPSGNDLVQAQERMQNLRLHAQAARRSAKEEQLNAEKQQSILLSRYFANYMVQGDMYFAIQIAEKCGENFPDEAENGTFTLTITATQAQKRAKSALDRFIEDMHILRSSGHTVDCHPTKYGATITNPGATYKSPLEDGGYSLSYPAIKLYFDENQTTVRKIIFLPSKSNRNRTLGGAAVIPFAQRAKR